jgi:hypothetical protein
MSRDETIDNITDSIVCELESTAGLLDFWRKTRVQPEDDDGKAKREAQGKQAATDKDEEDKQKVAGDKKAELTRRLQQQELKSVSSIKKALKEQITFMKKRFPSLYPENIDITERTKIRSAKQEVDPIEAYKLYSVINNVSQFINLFDEYGFFPTDFK